MNENNNTDREIGRSSRQRLCLIAGGWAGLVAETGGDSAGVKLDRRWTAMGGSCGRLVGHSWGGGRYASRVATEIMGH